MLAALSGRDPESNLIQGAVRKAACPLATLSRASGATGPVPSRPVQLAALVR